jgi:4a-hydroxytetrahydrobiopterin dehydratase
MSDLASKRCVPCEGGVPPLSGEEVSRLLSELEGWELSADGKSIARDYRFESYHQTMAFVNAVAWIAHQEDHHPDLEVFYDHCKVRYSTHAIGGLSENDLICAAKVSSLQAGKRSSQGSR